MRSARRAGRRLRATPALLCLGLACAAAASTAEATDAPTDFSSLSIEELANVEVTSVSRRGEALAEAPASIFVITQDDLRRSGVTTLPEALRLAPNLQVSRIDALDYAISARGLNGFESANKLLVMIDGRSVYTPLYSGVDWDVQQTPMADIERIEVISGPGGTLWGANAVNGVVSVTTRSAADTQGLQLDAAGGGVDSNVDIRYGGRLGAAAFRVYASAFATGPMALANGDEAADDWGGAQVGFRTDWSGARDSLTLQGDAYDHDIDESGGIAGYARGGNLLGRWRRQIGDTASLEVQAYYDETKRTARGTFDSLETWDLEAQHAFTPLAGHEVVWGGGYRLTRDEFENLLNPFVLDPPTRRITLGNVFAQDKIALAPDLALTLGLKLEKNSFTGTDYLPSARLAWSPSEHSLMWGSVSRAIRNPSRIERELVFPGILVAGDFQPEVLIAFEVGYRALIGERATVSVSAYHDAYDEIRSNDLSPTGGLPLTVGNTVEGEVSGVEAWGGYAVTPAWRLSAGVSALSKDFRVKPGSRDISRLEAAGVDPDFQAQLRSQSQLGDNVDLDLRLRHVDTIPASAADGYVGAAAYTELGARLGWRVRENLELSLVGANLLHDQHPEASETRRNEARRSIWAALRWRY